MVETKICSKCRRDIILEDYYYQDGKPRSMCKSCINLGVRASRKRNLERVRAYQNEYRKSHKDKINEYARKFKRTHPNYHRDYYRAKKMGSYELPNSDPYSN